MKQNFKFFPTVTGVNVHIITPIVCIVCIFYTCVGGLKAVVWTDVIQLCMMFFAIFLVMVKGTLDIGGIGVVWDKAVESGRIEFPKWVFPPFHLFRPTSIWSVGRSNLSHWTDSILCMFVHLYSHEFDLKTRHSIYSLVFGGFALWLKSNAVSQHMIQRYLALPTLRDARKWVSTNNTLSIEKERKNMNNMKLC